MSDRSEWSEWQKQADREFFEVQDQIAAREVAKANREAMIVKPLVFVEEDLPMPASMAEPQENRY
jgi:hypothetical protein